MLIALAATILLAGLWLTVLRPKTGTSPSAAAPVSAPGVKGLSRAVAHAKDVAAGRPTSDPVPAAQTAKTTAAPTATATTTAAAAPAKTTAAAAPATTTAAAAPATTTAAASPKAATAPKPVAPKPVAKPGVTLLLFSGHSADDTVARQVVRSLRRPGVRTIIAPVSRVGDYGSLLGTLEVSGSPTILVIGAHRRVRQFVGLPDRSVVAQALAAARRN